KAPAPQTRAPVAPPVQTPPVGGRRAVPAPSPPASAIRAAANPPRRPGAPAVPPPPPVAKKPGAQTALSNIREGIGALDDETGQPRQRRVPRGVGPSTPEAAAPPARVQAPAAPAPVAASSLSDTQVLKILENRRADESDRGNEEASSGISLLK